LYSLYAIVPGESLTPAASLGSSCFIDRDASKLIGPVFFDDGGEVSVIGFFDLF